MQIMISQHGKQTSSLSHDAVNNDKHSTVEQPRLRMYLQSSEAVRQNDSSEGNYMYLIHEDFSAQ